MKYKLLKDLDLFGDEPPVPTIEELQKQIETIQQEKDSEIEKLKQELESEKKKNAQYVLAGMTKQVNTPKDEDEEIEFDFGD